MPEEIATEATAKAILAELVAIHKILDDVWSDDSHYLRVHQTAVVVD